MKEDEFYSMVEKLGINLTEIMKNQLEIYANYLIEYNSHTNLTAIKDVEGIYLKHFYDSLMVTKFIDFNDINSIIDVGSGAGFPGVVLKIAFPNLKVTILDSNNKKTRFVQSLIEKLELNDINIENSRAEDFSKEHRHQYDISIARAVSELRILCELCLPLTKVGGYFISLKGNYEKELETSLSTIKVLNSEIETIDEDLLPIENSRRTFIKIKLEEKIDDKYPRPYDQIIKKPLK